MLLTSWIRGFQQRLLVRRAAQPRRQTSQFTPTVAIVEVLEQRQLLSGFAATDGASVVATWIGSYTAVQIQPGDQKIVAAGNAADPALNIGLAVARFDSQGNADATYGSGGLSNPLQGAKPQSAWALALQPDGKAVVAGDNGLDVGVARLNTNGSPDSSFGTGGFNTFSVQPGYDSARGIGLQSTGKIVVSGFSGSSTDPNSSVSSAFLARFTINGAIDSGNGGFGKVTHGKATGDAITSFGPNSNFDALAVQPDNKVVAVGTFSPASYELVVARYTAAGVLDTSFNGNGYSEFLPAGLSYTEGWSVALQSDGKVVAAGDCLGVDGQRDILVARFNSNGTLDTSFGGGAGYARLHVGGGTSPTYDYGRGVAIQSDGKIVVGGWETVSGVGASVLVTRFNTDGTPDQTFAPGGFKVGASAAGHAFVGYGIALESDGSIIVAGSDHARIAGTNGSTTYPMLTRFFGSSTPASALPASGNLALAPAAAPLTAMRRLTQPGGKWALAGSLGSNVGSNNLSQPGSTVIQVGGTVALAVPDIGGGSADNLAGVGDDLFDSHGTNLLKGRNRR